MSMFVVHVASLLRTKKGIAFIYWRKIITTLTDWTDWESFKDCIFKHNFWFTIWYKNCHFFSHYKSVIFSDKFHWMKNYLAFSINKHQWKKKKNPTVNAPTTALNDHALVDYKRKKYPFQITQWQIFLFFIQNLLHKLCLPFISIQTITATGIITLLDKSTFQWQKYPHFFFAPAAIDFFTCIAMNTWWNFTHYLCSHPPFSLHKPLTSIDKHQWIEFLST